jgi:type I restriction enzyme S subunit
MRKGWEIKKLGDICELYQPKTISSKEMVINGEYPVFGANGIIGTFDKYNHEEPQLLITCRGATCGSVNISLPKSWINGNAMVVRPVDNTLNLKFVEYLFRGGIDITKIITGAAQPQITRQNLSPILIAYPKSIKEQQEIVSMLDDAFESIERAKSNAEQNLKNAKELFQSYLQGVFKNKGEDWEEKTLEEIADVEYGYTDKSNEEGDYRYIRITDIDKNGELIISDKKYINYSKEASNFLIQENDLLMARTGATFAKVLLYNGNEPSVFASYLIRIKFKVDIENELYWHFTKTPNYWDQANSLQSGAAQPHFNGAAVKQVVFPYPKSVLEQKKIIHSFQELSIETKKLESTYHQKLNDLEELKKSILQKAFNGELKTSKKYA